MQRITDDDRRSRLAVRHHVTPAGRTDDVVRIADDLVALHSTDPVTVHLSVLARMARPDRAPLEQALYRDRTVVRHHAMRRTLWVATPPVARAMHAAASRKLVGPERHRISAALAAAGVTDPDGWLDDAGRQTLDYLRRHGPTGARELGKQIPALRQPLVLGSGTWATTVAAHTRVLILLGFAGQVIRAEPASWVSGAYRYAAADTWLPGGLGELEPREAAAELTRRWLRAFGPATATDLQWWMGWTAATTRQALADVEAVAVGLDTGSGWVASDDAATAGAEPWVALLPSLDPTVMGWKERDWYLPAAAAAAFDRNGNAGPTIWVDGRVVGAWGQDDDGRIVTHYFERVAADRRREVEARAAEVHGWVDGKKLAVRFPGAINAVLVARSR